MEAEIKSRVKSSIGAGRQSMFGLHQLMDFDWKLAVGDLELTEEEFRELLEEKRNLVRIRGTWIQLDPAMLSQMEQVMKRMQKKKGLSFRDVMELHLLGTPPGDPSDEWGQAVTPCSWRWN